MTLNLLRRLSIVFVLFAFSSEAFAQTSLINRFVDEMAETCDPEVLLQYKNKKRPVLRAIIARDVPYIDTDGTDVELYKLSCMGEGEDEMFAQYLRIEAINEFYLINFAVPAYSTEDFHMSDSSNYGDMSLMKMTGLRTVRLLQNPDFIAESDEIVTYVDYSGDGGAYLYAKWKWDHDQFEFVLKHFEVDESYDGIKNPTIRLVFE